VIFFLLCFYSSSFSLSLLFSFLSFRSLFLSSLFLFRSFPSSMFLSVLRSFPFPFLFLSSLSSACSSVSRFLFFFFICSSLFSFSQYHSVFPFTLRIPLFVPLFLTKNPLSSFSFFSSLLYSLPRPRSVFFSLLL